MSKDQRNERGLPLDQAVFHAMRLYRPENIDRLMKILEEIRTNPRCKSADKPRPASKKQVLHAVRQWSHLIDQSQEAKENWDWDCEETKPDPPEITTTSPEDAEFAGWLSDLEGKVGRGEIPERERST